MEKSMTNGGGLNPLLYLIRNMISKLKQNPDVYPIRYYKKSKRFRRNWQAPLVK